MGDYLRNLNQNRSGTIRNRATQTTASKAETAKRQQDLPFAKREKTTVTTEVAEVLAESQAEIQAASDFEKNNVKLSTGEYIDKEAYETLSEADQKLLNEIGIDKFNEQKQTEFEASYQKLDYVNEDGNNEYLDKETYNSLSDEDKALINKVGIDAYNTQKQADLEATTVLLSNGDRIDKAVYDTLSSDDQASLTKLGIDAFNEQKQAEFDANNVKLDTGEYIDKEAYNALSEDDQKLINELGIDGYNTQKQAELEASTVLLETGERIDKESYEALSDDDKELISVIGIVAYNEQKQAELDATTVLLDNGDRIDKESYETLSDDDKTLIMSVGIDAYNAQKQAELEANYVKLSYVGEDGNNEYVSRDYYDGLTYVEQRKLSSLGVEAFSQSYNHELGLAIFQAMIDADKIPSNAEFQSYNVDAKVLNYQYKTNGGVAGTATKVGKPGDYVTIGIVLGDSVLLSTGEYVDKESYESLSEDDRYRLNRYGVEMFNQYIEKMANFAAWVAEKRIPDKGYAIFFKDDDGNQYVSLYTGDVITAEAFQELGTIGQMKIKQTGIEGYNKWVEQLQSLPTITTGDETFYDLEKIAANDELSVTFVSSVEGGQEILDEYSALASLPTVTTDGQQYYDMSSIVGNKKLEAAFTTYVDNGQSILNDYKALASLPIITTNDKTYYDIEKIAASSTLTATFIKYVDEGQQIINEYKENQATLAALSNYKVTNLPGELYEAQMEKLGITLVGRENFPVTYNILAFIADNPNYSQASLAAVFGEEAVANAVKYSKDAVAYVEDVILKGKSFDIPGIVSFGEGAQSAMVFDAQALTLGLINAVADRVEDKSFENMKEVGLIGSAYTYDISGIDWEISDREKFWAQLTDSEKQELANAIAEDSNKDSYIASALGFFNVNVADTYEKINTALAGDAIATQIARGAVTGAADLVIGTISMVMIAGGVVGYSISGQGLEARNLIVSTGTGIADYFMDLYSEVVTSPFSGVPRALVVLSPTIVSGVKTGVKTVKSGITALSPHGIKTRALAIELDVSRIPFERAGYETTMRAVARALEEQLKTQPIDKNYVGKITVRFSDRVLELSAIATEKLNNVNTPIIRNLNLADAVNIPKNLATALLEYIQKHNGRVSGSFVDWLHLKDAARPHDIDVSFANQAKAMSDIVNIAKDVGYEARTVTHGVEIKLNGKWVKICDVDSIAHHNSAMLPEGIKAQPTDIVNGVHVETIGEQLTRLSKAVLTTEKTGAALASTKYYSRIEPLVEHIAEHLKDPTLPSKLTGVVELTYRRTPLQTIAPDTLYHATPNVGALLKELKATGKITLTRDFYTSPQAALDFLRRSARGEAPVDPGIIAVRTANMKGFRTPIKGYKGAIEAEVVGEKGVTLTATDLNWYGKAFGKKITGETFTQYQGITQTFETTISDTGKVTKLPKPVKITDGQFIPMYWLKATGATSSVPSIGQLYAATGMAFLESLKDIPYLRTRRIRFSFYGNEGAASPLMSTRKAYKIVVKIAEDLQKIAEKNVKARASSTWTAAKYAEEVGKELKALTEKETNRLSNLPEVREALRRDRAAFDQAYNINLSKYLALAVAGSQNAFENEWKNEVSEETPSVVSEYRYSNGELSEVRASRVGIRSTNALSSSIARESGIEPEAITPSTVSRVTANERQGETKISTELRTPSRTSEIKPIEPRASLSEIRTEEPIREEAPIREETPVEETSAREEPVREEPIEERLSEETPTDDDVITTVTLADGSEHKLTEKERKGAVGWKQGFIYKMIFPPYGKNNIVNSIKPIPGIKYYTGAESAYKSIVRLGGKLPKTIQRDMGIMDITITTSKSGEPKLRFTRDLQQRTNLTRRPIRHKPKRKKRLGEDIVRSTLGFGRM